MPRFVDSQAQASPSAQAPPQLEGPERGMVAPASSTLGSMLAREFVYGGHLLALGTSSIAAFCAVLLNQFPTVELLAMAYLFSYGAYSMNRSSEIEQDALSNPERTRHLIGRRKYLPAISGSCFAFGYLLAWMSGNELFFLALLIPLILSVGYSVGSKRVLLPLLGVKRLKEKLLVKNIAVSLGWSLIPLLVGLYYGEATFILPAVLGVFIFFRLFVNTTFFDVRDVAGDAANGIRTLPTTFGVRKTNFVLTLVDLMCGGYFALLISLKVVPVYSIAILSLPVYSIIYRSLSARRPSKLDLFCDVVADGEYLLWGFLLLLGRTLFI